MNASTLKTAISKEFGTMFGTFSKGIPGSRTINFGVSGGIFCADTCTLKGSTCYAEVAEKLKTPITKNLVKKQNNPDGYALEIANQAHKLDGTPFVRMSAFGSMPNAVSQVWIDSMKQLRRYVDPAIVHWPVETAWKAQIVDLLGYVPRLSLGLELDKVSVTVKTGRKVSVVFDCGKRARGKNKRAISQPAFKYAHELIAQGINARVCPAITGSAKCGACKLCTGSGPEVVIYPLH